MLNYNPKNLEDGIRLLIDLNKARLQLETLISAIKDHNLYEVKKLLSEQKTADFIINQVDNNGETPLIVAVKAVNAENIQTNAENIQTNKVIIDELIKAGASASKAGKNGDTPLILAIKLRDHHTVKRLASKNAVNIANKDGITPLMYAAILTNPRMIKDLLASGANHQVINGNLFALAFAVLKQDTKTVEALMTADNDNKDFDGNFYLSALHIAKTVTDKIKSTANKGNKNTTEKNAENAEIIHQLIDKQLKKIILEKTGKFYPLMELTKDEEEAIFPTTSEAYNKLSVSDNTTTSPPLENTWAQRVDTQEKNNSASDIRIPTPLRHNSNNLPDIENKTNIAPPTNDTSTPITVKELIEKFRKCIKNNTNKDPDNAEIKEAISEKLAAITQSLDKHTDKVTLTKKYTNEGTTTTYGYLGLD